MSEEGGDSNSGDTDVDQSGDMYEQAANHQGNVTATYLRMRADELGNAGPHNF